MEFEKNKCQMARTKKQVVYAHCGLQLVKNVEIKISQKEVFEIPVDIAIMDQDTNRVFGPSPQNCLKEDLQQEIHSLIDELKTSFQPRKPGEIIVTKNSCAAKYMIETVVYQLDQPQITRRDIVFYCLQSSFLKAAELKASTLAINPLGTESPTITYQHFLQMLKQTYQQYQQELSGLKKIIFTLRSGKPFKPLINAIGTELNIIPEFFPDFFLVSLNCYM